MKKVGLILMVCFLLCTMSLTASAADSATIPYEDLKFVAGDVDCNEKIELDDLTALRKVLLGVNEPEREGTADATGDGEINIVDLVCLKKYFAGDTKLGK